MTLLQYIVYFLWVLAGTLIDLWLGLLCLLFSVGCSCCITACSYIVLPCYIPHLKGSCRAGFVFMSRCYSCCTLHIGTGKEDRPRYNCCLLIEPVAQLLNLEVQIHTCCKIIRANKLVQLFQFSLVKSNISFKWL